MSAVTLLSISLFSVAVGILIGCVGIGGVLLVPLLTYAANIDIHVAVAAVMFSYIFSGTIGTVMYARRRSINWRMAILLSMGAAPAAFAGAWATSPYLGGSPPNHNWGTYPLRRDEYPAVQPPWPADNR